MKLWKVLIGLFLLGLLLAPALRAQIPFYDYPTSIYYSGTYYPYAYYPQQLYALDPVSTSAATYTVNALTRQVQELEADVQMLRTQILQAQTEMNQARTAAIAAAVAAERPAESVVLVLKNGQQLMASGYAVSGDTVWMLRPSAIEKVALSELDLAATRKANLTRGVTVRSETK